MHPKYTRARRARAAGLLASLALAATAAAALLAAGLTAAPASAQSPFISTPVVAATVRPTSTPWNYVTVTPTSTPAASSLESTPARALRELQLRIISMPEAFVGIGGRIDSVVNPRVDVWAGEDVRLTLINNSSAAQTFSLPAFNFVSPEIAAGESLTIQFTPVTVGEFEYASGDADKRAAGMRGVLRVAGIVEIGSRVGDIFAAAEATVIVCEAPLSATATPAPG